MAEDLCGLSAGELGSAYRDRRLSPVEVTKAVLARVEACEPRLNAMYLVQAEQALEQARASERRWQQSAPLSALDGVPITIKDNVATRGTPTPVGTAAGDTTSAAAEDAPPAARVREAGCVMLGKTTMPDFGMLCSGMSSLHGTTRNPWDLSRNTGGSSSGAAAAVAGGYGPLALGTDIGGSVRLPAAYCGIVALKPSLGRVPIHPPYFGRVTGPMTRTVEDTALLMDILKQPDDRDFMNLPPEPEPYAGDPAAALKGKRIGLMLDVGTGTKPTEEVRVAVEAAARAFEQAGAIVEPVGPIMDARIMDGLNRFFQTRSCSDLLKMDPARQAKVLPFIRAWCLPAVRWSAVDFFEALNCIFEMRERAVKATVQHDFLLSPTSPIPAYEAEAPCPGSDPSRPFEHICFTAPFNQSEQPAASVPCGFTGDGLPIGLQIVGHRFDDRGVLQMARAWEELRPAMRAWPSL
ncbi:amidase [Geminicoccaceae bacterium 1502E]|nr:amidase [Geminicoccaceae bacterium 1502E]